ncbi:MAG: TolC family protein, partial [Pseudomonadota bacterium]
TTNRFFSADQLAGSILGSINARLFEGGAIRANIRLQQAEAREAATSYAIEVLEAMREVETALQAEVQLEKELQQQSLSLTALKQAERLTENRYLNGVETLRNFLETQQRRYQTEQSYLLTQQEKWRARINLYLALGGDWFGQSNDQCQALIPSVEAP